MNIVVDIGCFPHPIPAGGVEESIPQLIARFDPDVLYGFDPWPEQENEDYVVGRTRVILRRAAAWTEGAVLKYDPREIGSTVMREKNLHGEWRRPEPMHVNGFDFPAWLEGMVKNVHPGHRWIVKLDCEGAEFPILDALCDRGLDVLPALIVVEWHDKVMEAEFRARRASLEGRLRCPVELWADGTEAV